MATYTISIEAGNIAENAWQEVSLSIIDDQDWTSAMDAATDISQTQSVVEGSHWRIRVWEGIDFDADPDAVVYGADLVGDDE